MKFNKTKVTIKPFKVLSTTMAAVNGGEPQHVMKVEIPIEVAVDKKLLKDKEFNVLFPFADEAIKVIAAREGEEQRGLDLKSRGSIEPINVRLWDAVPSEKPAFEFNGASVRGAATLKVDEKGEGVLCSKINVLATKEQLGNLGPYVKGEILIESEAAQSSIFDLIADDGDGDDGEDGDDDTEDADEGEEGTGPDPFDAAEGAPAEKPKREPRSPSQYDHKEGAITYLASDEAVSLATEAVQLNTVKTDVGGLFASARKFGRKRVGLAAKRLTIGIPDMQKAIAEQATDEAKNPLADPPSEAKKEAAE